QAGRHDLRPRQGGARVADRRRRVPACRAWNQDQRGGTRRAVDRRRRRELAGGGARATPPDGRASDRGRLLGRGRRGAVPRLRPSPADLGSGARGRRWRSPPRALPRSRAGMNGRVALITGCGKPKGGGEAIARALAADGVAVVVTDRVPTGVLNRRQEIVGSEQPASWSGLDSLVAEIEAA